jgi:hypothetical protein
MRRIIFLLTTGISAGLISCQKADEKPALPLTKTTTGAKVDSITGNWKVISDSAYSNVGAAYQFTLIKGYTGKSSDYFNFTSGGKLYAQENDTLRTAAYLQSKDTLLLNYPELTGQKTVTANFYPSAFFITSLTTNSAVIISSLESPGGEFVRKITLGK